MKDILEAGIDVFVPGRYKLISCQPGDVWLQVVNQGQIFKYVRTWASTVIMVDEDGYHYNFLNGARFEKI